jgi:hypothetical protein
MVIEAPFVGGLRHFFDESSASQIHAVSTISRSTTLRGIRRGCSAIDPHPRQPRRRQRHEW